MTNIEDGKLLEMIRLGKDKDAIPLLYKKVLPQLKSYILKNNGTKEDAFDIFHDALMLFYEQVIKGEFNSKYNIYGYLYRVGVFRWINKSKKDKSIVLLEELPELPSNDLSERFDKNDITQDGNILKTLFSQLGEKCVELLTYTIYSDMLMEDVMVRMGFGTVEAVRMQHVRCKQKLMKEVQSNPSLINKLKGT